MWSKFKSFGPQNYRYLVRFLCEHFPILHCTPTDDSLPPAEDSLLLVFWSSKIRLLTHSWQEDDELDVDKGGQQGNKMLI